MTKQKLVDARTAREQTQTILADREKERLILLEEERLYQLEMRRQLRREKARLKHVTGKRNELVRQALSYAAQGRFLCETQQWDADIILAVEQVGLFIEEKVCVVDFMGQPLFDHWNRSAPGRIIASYLLTDLQNFLTEHISVGFSKLKEKADPRYVAKFLLEEHYSDIKSVHISALQKKLTRLYRLENYNYLKDPTDLIWCNKRRAEFAATPVGARVIELRFSELDFYELIRLVRATVAQIESMGRSEPIPEISAVSRFGGIQKRIEKDLKSVPRDSWLLTWYRYPYLEEMYAQSFAEGLFWLASEGGQSELEKVNTQILESVNEGHSSTKYLLRDALVDKVLVNVMKHCLRVNGYKVTIDSSHKGVVCFVIEWT
jgi:hypothetical protein